MYGPWPFGRNVYLQAEALGLGTVALGAFNDLKLRPSVQMTGGRTVYIMPFGKRPIRVRVKW